MKYSLTFCDIYQISDDIFEVVDKEGVTIDHDCAEESWTFWNTIRKEPFDLLVNCKNSFSLSFEGAQEIGNHPLQRKTALLIMNVKQQEAISTAIQVKQAMGPSAPHKIFTDRNEAIKWLSNLP